jgi:hypothetical protein
MSSPRNPKIHHNPNHPNNILKRIRPVISYGEPATVKSVGKRKAAPATKPGLFPFQILTRNLFECKYLPVTHLDGII